MAARIVVRECKAMTENIRGQDGSCERTGLGNQQGDF